MRRIMPIIAASALTAAVLTAGCTVAGRSYTGDEFYYTQDGINYTCREPKPYRGGNCRRADQWRD
jgi:hypothetical protein